MIVTKESQIIRALDTVDRLFISGPPGVGKTYLSTTYKSNKKQNIYTCTLTKDTPAYELRGSWSFDKGGAMVWNDGPAVRAMREGGRLVINEISHGGPDVMGMLFSLCDTGHSCHLTLPSGETVFAKPGYQVVATDNYRIYELDPPLQSRFAYSLRIDNPTEGLMDLFPKSFHALINSSLVGSAYDPYMVSDKSMITPRHWIVFFEQIEKHVQCSGDLKFFCNAIFGTKGDEIYKKVCSLVDEKALGAGSLKFKE